MLNLKMILPFLVVGQAFAGIDMPAVDKEIEKVSNNIKKEKTFSDKFKHVTYLEGFLKKEIEKINDKNYEQEKNNLFKLNFYRGNILGLTTPFPEGDCSYQRDRLIRNFSHYKTGEIHEKIKPLAKVPLKIIDSICNKK